MPYTPRQQENTGFRKNNLNVLHDQTSIESLLCAPLARLNYICQPRELTTATLIQQCFQNQMSNTCYRLLWLKKKCDVFVEVIFFSIKSLTMVKIMVLTSRLTQLTAVVAQWIKRSPLKPGGRGFDHRLRHTKGVIKLYQMLHCLALSK